MKVAAFGVSIRLWRENFKDEKYDEHLKCHDSFESLRRMLLSLQGKELARPDPVKRGFLTLRRVLHLFQQVCVFKIPDVIWEDMLYQDKRSDVVYTMKSLMENDAEYLAKKKWVVMAMMHESCVPATRRWRRW